MEFRLQIVDVGLFYCLYLMDTSIDYKFPNKRSASTKCTKKKEGSFSSKFHVTIQIRGIARNGFRTPPCDVHAGIRNFWATFLRSGALRHTGRRLPSLNKFDFFQKKMRNSLHTPPTLPPHAQCGEATLCNTCQIHRNVVEI